MAAVKKQEVPLTTGQIEAVLAALAHFGKEVPVYFRLRPNLKDENDNMVFECAANYGAEAIITHNVRDFQSPELKGYGIKILKPDAFLQSIRRMA